MKLISEVKLEEIFTLLPENIKKLTSSSDLKELDASKDQKLTRKRFFHLKKSNRYDIHITYGYNLDEVYRNSKSFHKNYPQLSCKPIFLSGQGEIKLFGQEFFDGKPIDLVFNDGTIKENDTCQIIEEIYKILSEKIEPSSKKAAREEFRNFKKNVLLNKDFKEVDRKTLTSYIFPQIEKELLVKSPTIRWSSGDLSARNILINAKHKTFKIIDCEFAYYTHFYEEDWFRLKNFSTGKFQSSEFLREKIESLNPVWETYLRLRQTVLNKFVHTSDSYAHYAGDDLFRSLNVFEALPDKSDENEPLIIKAFHHAQNHYRNQLNGESSRCTQLEEKLLKDEEKINFLEKSFEANENKRSELESDVESKTIFLSKLEMEKQKLSEELISKQSLLEREIEEKEKTIISLNNERNNTNSLNKELELQKIAFADKNSQLDDAKNLNKKISGELKSMTFKYNQASDRICKDVEEIDKLIEDKAQLQNKILLVKKIIDKKISIISSQNISLNKLKERLNVSNDKIYRMQTSFSWKLTSVFRFFRRKILDPFRFRFPPDFDPKVYLELNPDLKTAFGDNIEDAYQHFRNYGIHESRQYSKDIYTSWVDKYDSDETKIAEYSKIKSSEKKEHIPLFSIIMPVFDPEVKFLEHALDSVMNQIYQNWELCVCDDASRSKDVKSILRDYAQRDSRIKLSFRKTNGHISRCSNEASKMAVGRYLIFFDHDDLLRPHSLQRISQVIEKNGNLKLIYSDEDKIDINGKRRDPYFKPDWNPDLLLSQNYICHLTCCYRESFKRIGGFREGLEGTQDWDLFLRLTEIIKENEIFHIPEILYHWRQSPQSTSKTINSKTYVLEAAKKTLLDALDRRKIKGKILPANNRFNYWHIQRKLPLNKPFVSILIPTKDKLSLLQTCIGSLLQITDYSNFEVIVLDNDSTEEDTLNYFLDLNKKNNVRVVKISGPFNYSAINNAGVKIANGEVIILLNNDIEVIESGWLREIISHAVRKEVGCVGAKLLYPDDTIQHAGVILGLGGVAGHAHKYFPKDHNGHKCRLHLVQNFVAVTAACLAVRKEIFEQVGGLNEKHLTVAFNDVDFCMRVHEAGYLNVWTPHATLYHHESASRGSDETPEKMNRFRNEITYMKKRWGEKLLNDPTYNPNLTLDREDFSLSFPPRTKL